MTNGFANGIWKKALKTAVSVGSGVLAGEIAVHGVSDWHSVLHALYVTALAIAGSELRYWQKWAGSDNVDGNRGGGPGSFGRSVPR